MGILSDKEIAALINEGVADAVQELQDNGKELTVECHVKNGDTKSIEEYGKRIDSQKYNEVDLERHARLKKLTGIAS